MSNTVNMPALGESVTEGTVTRWLKEVGESIEVDEPLLEVSTDKVDTEIPSPYAGVVEEILAEEDDDVEVGGALAVIGDGSGGGSDESAAQEDAPAEDQSDEQDEAPAAEEPADEPAEEETEEPAEEQQSAPTSTSSGTGDATEVTMPALGESVTEGTVTRWLKEVGESIEVDEPLLEVSTDKVDTEVPSPVAGTVLELFAEEDEEVEVGAKLALVGSKDSAGGSDDSGADDSGADEEPAAEADEAPAEEAPAEDLPVADEAQDEAPAAADSEPEPSSAPAEEAPQVVSGGDTPASGEDIARSVSGDNAAYVTPLVRKLAKSKGVDLRTLKGTGVGGRIRKQDVLNAAATPAPVSGSDGTTSGSGPRVVELSEEAKKLRGTTQKSSRIRQTIAKRMRESLQNTSQLTQVSEVDVTGIANLRKATKDAFQEKHGVKLTYLPFFIKAVVEALQIHPEMNSQLGADGKEIEYFDHEHVGIAVDTPRGLLVPVIKNAGDLSIAGISKAIDDVADRTRNNKIKPDELSGGTFSVTNIGSFGAIMDTPIINYPQSGILGVGTIVRRPMIVQTADGAESIAIRDMVYLPLTYNHELVDGADAGRFLKTIRERLQEADFEGDLEL
ncbi:2-oxoglutarate dehydrogenase, E2 component, dihydrolipoamide succinyltransferase [Brevibacterium jeotgali]|uniref:Dihydrolipoamide acetyltransferase component of pyruvate dehydrogenase complex n=1 Tax=Brevibacterium jeotgali TaxID=1262550 RepID=A0A2H1L8A5_9MICO|nr:2-oxoglutarate dehydrogenase, E2 component, dihydrolipoamide succinyltransferase [Brevibacterium jeotgali]TWC02752.1 2-oxoglutarate dehydrogenase E2 component [Brevibacterium jeotgali]SMY13136.1 2-oxoglutarate dehydrogenase E2 component [Brevibacterium jeotgali]